MAMPDPDCVLPRALMVLVGGLGDVSVPALGDQTPLVVAYTPILDAIAARSRPLSRPDWPLAPCRAGPGLWQ
ncbi:predicted protein [Haematococcus lacustris]|uniref:Uncharacterized protein n=1 Tax=Haematococcus lacustris TaxID=44745 RepID=A0A6A0AAE4_HAELA|nr:predicted protein [Haematococcus lacustris]